MPKHSEAQRELLCKLGSEKALRRLTRMLRLLESKSFSADGLATDEVRKQVYVKLKALEGVKLNVKDIQDMSAIPQYNLYQPQNIHEINAIAEVCIKDKRAAKEFAVLYSLAASDLGDINQNRRKWGKPEYCPYTDEKLEALNAQRERKGQPLLGGEPLLFADEDPALHRDDDLDTANAALQEYGKKRAADTAPLTDRELRDLQMLVGEQVVIVAEAKIENERFPYELQDLYDVGEAKGKFTKLAERFFDAKEVEAAKKDFLGSFDNIASASQKRRDEVHKNKDGIYYDKAIEDFLHPMNPDPQKKNLPHLAETVYEGEFIDIKFEKSQILKGLMMLNSNHIFVDQKEEIWRKLRTYVNRRVNFIKESGGSERFFAERIKYEKGSEEIEYLQMLTGLNSSLEGIAQLGELSEIKDAFANAKQKRKSLDEFAKPKAIKEYRDFNFEKYEKAAADDIEPLKELYVQAAGYKGRKLEAEEKALKVIGENKSALEKAEKKVNDTQKAYASQQKEFDTIKPKFDDAVKEADSDARAVKTWSDEVEKLQKDLKYLEDRALVTVKGILKEAAEKEYAVKLEKLKGDAENAALKALAQEKFKVTGALEANQAKAEKEYNEKVAAADKEYEQQTKAAEDALKKNTSASDKAFEEKKKAFEKKQKAFDEESGKFEEKAVVYREKSKDLKAQLQVPPTWSIEENIPAAALLSDSDAARQKEFIEKRQELLDARDDANNLQTYYDQFTYALKTSVFSSVEAKDNIRPDNDQLSNANFSKAFIATETRIEQINEKIFSFGDVQHQLVLEAIKLKDGKANVNDVRNKSIDILNSLGETYKDLTKNNIETLNKADSTEKFMSALQGVLGSHETQVKTLLTNLNTEGSKASAELKKIHGSTEKLLAPYLKAKGKAPISRDEALMAFMKDGGNKWQNYSITTSNLHHAQTKFDAAEKLAKMMADDYSAIKTNLDLFFKGELKNRTPEITQAETNIKDFESSIKASLKNRLEQDSAKLEDAFLKDSEAFKQVTDTYEKDKAAYQQDEKAYNDTRKPTEKTYQDTISKLTLKHDLDKAQLKDEYHDLLSQYEAQCEQEVKALEKEHDPEAAQARVEEEASRRHKATLDEIEQLKAVPKESKFPKIYGPDSEIAACRKELSEAKENVKTYTADSIKSAKKRDELAKSVTKISTALADKKDAHLNAQETLLNAFGSGMNAASDFTKKFNPAVEEDLSNRYNVELGNHDHIVGMLYQAQEIQDQFEDLAETVNLACDKMGFKDAKSKTDPTLMILDVADLERKTNLSESLRAECESFLQDKLNAKDNCRTYSSDSSAFTAMITALEVALGKKPDPAVKNSQAVNAFRAGGTHAERKAALEKIKKAADTYKKKREGDLFQKSRENGTQRYYRLGFAKALIDFADEKIDAIGKFTGLEEGIADDFNEATRAVSRTGFINPVMQYNNRVSLRIKSLKEEIEISKLDPLNKNTEKDYAKVYGEGVKKLKQNAAFECFLKPNAIANTSAIDIFMPSQKTLDKIAAHHKTLNIANKSNDPSYLDKVFAENKEKHAICKVWKEKTEKVLTEEKNKWAEKIKKENDLKKAAQEKNQPYVPNQVKLEETTEQKNEKGIKAYQNLIKAQFAEKKGLMADILKKQNFDLLKQKAENKVLENNTQPVINPV